jgi:hypothetical protein
MPHQIILHLIARLLFSKHGTLSAVWMRAQQRQQKTEPLEEAQLCRQCTCMHQTYMDSRFSSRFQLAVLFLEMHSPDLD